MPSRSLEAAAAAHIRQIIKSVRELFVTGATIEEALDVVLRAAAEEFHCRIAVSRPAHIVVDGFTYEWPAIDGKYSPRSSGESNER
jgi:hypothetical protein